MWHSVSMFYSLLQKIRSKCSYTMTNATSHTIKVKTVVTQPKSPIWLKFITGFQGGVEIRYRGQQHWMRATTFATGGHPWLLT